MIYISDGICSRWCFTVNGVAVTLDLGVKVSALLLRT